MHLENISRLFVKVEPR